MYHVFIDAGGEVLCKTVDDAIDYVRNWVSERGALNSLTFDFSNWDMKYIVFHIDHDGYYWLGCIELLPIWNKEE